MRTDTWQMTRERVHGGERVQRGRPGLTTALAASTPHACNAPKTCVHTHAPPPVDGERSRLTRALSRTRAPGLSLAHRALAVSSLAPFSRAAPLLALGPHSPATHPPLGLTLPTVRKTEREANFLPSRSKSSVVLAPPATESVSSRPPKPCPGERMFFRTRTATPPSAVVHIIRRSARAQVSQWLWKRREGARTR